MTGEFNIALHALIYLYHAGETLSSEQLAKNICTNPARVRLILSKLRKAGFVSTREGAEGGYHYAADGSLTLRQVAEALSVRFVSASWHSGCPERSCPLCSGMADLMENIYRGLNDECLLSLEKVTVADAERALFG